MSTFGRTSHKHPGSILYENFMRPRGLSANRLGLETHLPVQRIHDIINHRRGITAETAIYLSAYLGTTAKYWLDLQTSYELEQAELKLGQLNRRIPRKSIAAQTEHTRQPELAKLTKDQRTIFDLIKNSQSPIDSDRLCDKSGLRINQVNAILTELELLDLVRRLAGDRYSA